MTTLTFPTLSVDPASVEWQCTALSYGSVSALDGSSQLQSFVGARWGVTLVYHLFTDADADLLKAWLMKMRGGANVVAMWNMERPYIFGTGTGAPVKKVLGAGQTGSSLLTNGWVPGSTLKAGDFIGVNGELKMVVEDVTTPDGNLTIPFEPPLRESPPDDEPIVTDKPTCLMRLTEDIIRWSPRALSVPSHRYHEFTIQLVEVFQ